MIWIMVIWAGIFLDAFGANFGWLVAAAGAAAAAASGIYEGQKNGR